MTHHSESVGRAAKLFVIAFTLLIGIVGGRQQRVSAAPLSIQNAAIKMTVEPGFQGRFHDSHWLPLQITLSNSGPDVSGELHITPAAIFNSTTNNFASTIDLPTGSNKQLFLYVVLNNAAQSVRVDLVAPDGVLIQSAEAPITGVDANDLLYAVISESPTGAVDLTGARGSGAAYQADWRIENIPTMAQALGGLDALVLTDVDTGKLSLDQRSAIHDWVLSGGHLIVTGGPNWQRTRAGVDGLVPLSAGGSLTLDSLSALRTYAGGISKDTLDGTVIVASGQPISGAQVLASQNGQPLLVRAPQGLGLVDYLAADPGLEPFRSWGDRAHIWSNLLISASHKPGWANGVISPYEAQAAAQFIKENLLSVFQLAGFLLIYILLIGPLNYLVLRRLGRPVLAWVTIPVIILLTTITTYTTGFNLRGGAAIMNRMAIVQVWPGAAQAQLDGVLGVLAPRRGNYSLTMDEGLTLRSLNVGANPLDINSIKILEGRQFVAQNVPIDAGIAATFQTGGFVKAPAISGTATLAIASDGKASVSGVIHNESKLTLTDAVVMIMNTPIRLGMVAAGETRQFHAPVISLDQALPSAIRHTAVYSSSYYPNSYSSTQPNSLSVEEMLLNGYSNGYPYNLSNTPLGQEITRRARFLNGMLDSSNQGEGRGLDVYLAGWTDNSPMGVQIDAASNAEDSTLYIVKLTSQVVAPDAHLRLLPGYMQWAPVGGSNQLDYSPYSTYITSGNAAQFQFNPQAAVHLSTVNGLTISGRFSSSTFGLISVFDWLAARWVPLPLPAAQDFRYDFNGSSDLSRFIGPGNGVQVRIEPQNNSVNIERFDVLLDGALNLPPSF